MVVRTRLGSNGAPPPAAWLRVWERVHRWAAKQASLVVVLGEDEVAARAALEKAGKIYGGHMGAGLEEHGIWGSPEAVIERIEAHRRMGVSFFVIEFFGRDTREPARLFAEKVMPAFAS